MGSLATSPYNSEAEGTACLGVKRERDRDEGDLGKVKET